MKPITRGDLMTIKEWVKDVADRMLIDYDGYGYLATTTHKSDICVIPSEATEVLTRTDVKDGTFTHIIWYNR